MKFDLMVFVNDLLVQIEKYPWFAQKAIGTILIVIGLLGLILPILPGWLFILPGVSILHPPLKVAMLQFEKTKKIFKRLRVGTQALKTLRFKRLKPVLDFK
jgi:hypothetical protein